jgi:RNA polymerase sigma-70 factor (ECF subfamily)
LSDHKRRRIEEYLSRLLGYALSLTTDRDAAEELVHECAVRSLAAKRVPDDEPAYRAWLFRILRNAFLDQVRNAGREFAAPNEEPKVDGSAVWDYDDRLISVLTVRAAMARLAPHHREIIALVDLAGFSYGEAATILEVPRGTVMSRLSRARGALLDQIAEGNVHPLDLAVRRGKR